MNLLQGPVGHSLPPPTEAGPGFQSGNKFDIDMCVLAAQGSGGRWQVAEGRGLTSWWPTCLPCQWQQQCDGRRRNRKQRTENENRKQKTENETTTKTTEKLCEKGGKMQALFSRLPAELKGNDACNIAAVAAAAAAADGSRAGSTRSTSTIPGGSRTFQ